MVNGALQQGLQELKVRLREFLETTDTGRQAMAMSGHPNHSDSISLHTLDGEGKRKPRRLAAEDQDDEEDM